MTPYQRYCGLRDSRKLNDSAVATGAKIPKSTFTEWKNGRSTPKQEKMQKIADFFGVSVEWLMFGVEPSTEDYFTNPETAKLAQEILDNPDLRVLVDAARDASPEDMRRVIKILQALKEE